MDIAMTTPTKTSTPTRKQLERLLPACTISFGYVLDGAGSARYGWSATTASGCTRFLGRGPKQAVSAAKSLGESWGAR